MAMENPFEGKEVWFGVGSQDLYGEEALRQVAEQSGEIVDALNATGKIPVKVVLKPTLKSSDGVKAFMVEASANPNVIGVITWCHTFSPAKMWIRGLEVLTKPLLQLNTAAGYWGLIILMCWQQIGYMMIIYIAGLQAVPEDMLEAARIDGANRWQTLWRVTIPNVMPSITICMFLSLTNGFKLFDQNLALTAGRPFQQLGNGETIKTTEMLALNIVNAFGTSGGGNRGVGQAKAVIFFIVVAAISIIQLQANRRKEVQQ